MAGQWSLPAVGPLKRKPSVGGTGGSRGTLGLSQDIPYQEAKTLFPELFGSKDSGLKDSPLHGTNQTCKTAYRQPSMEHSGSYLPADRPSNSKQPSHKPRGSQDRDTEY